MNYVIPLAMALGFALPCFSLGVRLLHTWFRPLEVEEGRWVSLGVGLLVLEFLLLHSGVALSVAATSAASLGGKLAAVVGLTAVYALFVAGISWVFRSRMLFESFLWILGGRFVALGLGIAGDEGQLLAARSVIGTTLFIAVVVASTLLPFPRFGITDEIASAQRSPGSSGLWADEPHRAIGAGALYFLGLGVVELFFLSWIDPSGLVSAVTAP